MTETDRERILREVAEDAEQAGDTVSPTARRKKRTSPDPNQVYSVRIPVDRIEQLRQAALNSGTTPSALIRELVVRYLDDQPAAAKVEGGNVAPLMHDIENVLRAHLVVPPRREANTGRMLAREANEAEERADAEERGDAPPTPGHRARRSSADRA